jgi:hydroxymethylbilane synthase
LKGLLVSTFKPSNPGWILKHKLTIGTRGSKLALAQAEIARAALLGVRPELEVRLECINTKGDLVQDRPLSEIGGNGVFVTQIEEALRAGTIDVAVHSAKDLPSTLAPGMVLAAFLPRADPRDVVVSRHGAGLSNLPSGSRIGTSSPRRACQVLALRPDLEVRDIRGNVDTRLRRLHSGEYDAIVLAAAGLERLAALDCVTEWLDPAVMLPAVGQGALALEARAGDSAVLDLIGEVNHADTSAAVLAERAFLARIGASCTLPVAAHATLVENHKLRIVGMIAGSENRMARGERLAERSEAQDAASGLAAELLAKIEP